MRMILEAARDLSLRSLGQLGYDAAQAAIIADHLMDCELRGLGYSGLARILSIAGRLDGKGPARGPMQTLRESPVSARMDGGDHVGYLVAEHATRIAIEKALSAGIAVVGANRTWYTGMLSYYGEMAAEQGLVMAIASNATPWVAPHGGTQGRFGTNPICFAFPSADEPVIWDIGTSAIIHAQVVLAKRLGQALPAGVAFDADGLPTRDAAAALAGAFAPWGGHRGSGLAMVVQLLGVLAGSPAMPGELEEFGYLAIAIRPDLLTDPDTFRQEVSRYAAAVRATRPEPGGATVRMPFDRSRAERERRRAEGAIDVPDAVVSALEALPACAASGR
ncbi:Ldh family oxidoreductase [Roseomonas sp. E05]|uniref:Ldh family oxidoreductase n=1 Tax=Roseomonas sp. E05 TaxID=3046310 RepID=UPI0024BB7D3E|nr:Ldh family oxidoreductase [Roseomonas sp. E05]MDJ0388719.1 Ldh family oxidoreductase [Roseomonas sp. E05]